MEEILIKNATVRDSKYRYYINSEGDLVRKKYSYLTDPYTIITILIIIAAIFYYTDVKTCHETLNHIDKTCEVVWKMQQEAISKNVSNRVNFSSFFENATT